MNPPNINQLNRSKYFLSEILKMSNDSQDPIESLKTFAKDDVRLISILGYAINPKFKIANVIPDGEPPEYKESELPLGMADLDILKLHNKIYILFNPELKQFKKEEFFLRWIESMHPTDVKLFVAIKDQKISSLYPKLTNDVIRQALGWSTDQYNKLFT